MADNPPDVVHAAAVSIQARIAPLRRRIQHLMQELDALERISMLGYLAADALEDFPPDDRPAMRAAFIEALQDDSGAA